MLFMQNFSSTASLSSYRYVWEMSGTSLRMLRPSADEIRLCIALFQMQLNLVLGPRSYFGIRYVIRFHNIH
jgi:hypothetical protein